MGLHMYGDSYGQIDEDYVIPGTTCGVGNCAGNTGPTQATWAGLFILSLVDPMGDDLFAHVEAMAAWDEPHRDAFRSWAADPFSASD